MSQFIHHILPSIIPPRNTLIKFFHHNFIDANITVSGHYIVGASRLLVCAKSQSFRVHSADSDGEKCIMKVNYCSEGSSSHCLCFFILNQVALA